MADRSESSLLPVLVPAGGLLLAGLIYIGVTSYLASTRKPVTPPPGMVWIPGGTFKMGSDAPEFQGEAQPIHPVTVHGFWMDATEVTNEQFAEFVKATGYITVAEKPPDPAQFPNVKKEELKPFSAVFTPPVTDTPTRRVMDWWQKVYGADWKHPDGPGSSIGGKEKYPVVHISWVDADAYAKWAGKRLPTEAEWEFAARGGLEGMKYAWGDDFRPGGKSMANTCQGHFPEQNLVEDGHRTAAPVGSFPPNPYGLYDMAGNVWEWCSDWYSRDYFKNSPKDDPQGPESSNDPTDPKSKRKVQKGGSFLCAENYCARYQVGARHSGEMESAADHIGFRCVKDR